MLNNVRRCLTVSVRTRGKLLIRSIHENVLSPVLHSRANNARRSNNAVYKRFYCQSTIDEQNLKSIDLKNQQDKLDQQKLDDVLSDPENKKRFQILELELDVLRHNAERVPDNIEPSDWLLLLNSPTKTRRKRYLEFLWRNERASENEKAKKALKKAEALAKKEAELADDTGEMKYGLLHNTLFMRIYETTINRFYNGKLLQSMMFEPKLVFDCGYDDDMNHREIHNCAKQLSLAFASNRLHADPMCLYFCNFNKDGLLKRYLHQNIPTLMNNDFPVTVTSQSYLDLFPKNQLVYLTPHCRVNLNEYDPDAVYIIGALVDKTNSQPLSLAKAKREGISMAKFPIDTYLDWGASSSKNLTLDQCTRIMLDLRHTRDWNKALSNNVPTRKLRNARENSLRQKLYKSISSDTYKIEEPAEVPLKDFTFGSRKIKN